MANSVKVRLQRKVICPHCWTEFPPEEALWIAEHSELLGDPRLGRDERLRFLPTRFNVNGQALDPKGFSCTALACPHCHLETPRAMVELPAHFWSILGAPASGKSFFLAAMIWQLRKILAQGFSVSFSDVDPAFNSILNEYEELIFLNPDPQEVVAIRKTDLQGDLYNTVLFGNQTVSYPRPFIFAVRLLNDHPRQQNSEFFGRILCLYDNAGEHFLPGQDSVDSPVTRHLARSRVLMFLFDPTQDPRFRRACQGRSNDPQLSDRARTSRQETVLHEAASRIRKHAGLAQHEKHNRPLIVIVTKFDAWSPMLDNCLIGTPYVRRKSGNFLTLDQTYVESVSQNLRRLLWEETPEIVAAAESFSDEVCYIPVSATGCQTSVDPKTGVLGVRPCDMNPFWVEVPMLYAMSRWLPGVVPYVRDVLRAPHFQKQETVPALHLTDANSQVPATSGGGPATLPFHDARPEVRKSPTAPPPIDELSPPRKEQRG